MVRTILIVDDDDDLRQSLIEQLGLDSDFVVMDASTATSGIEMVRSSHIDLLIMDLGLPDLDGREAIRRLRSEGYDFPVIILTGHDTDVDTIAGLDAGANDYVSKPFRFGVLLARIRAQLRQHEHSDSAVFEIGHYVFTPSQKLLVDSEGSKVRLTEKESSILRFLYRASKSVSREILLSEVWGYNSGVTTHTLETHIYRLRRKIERDPSRPELLVTGTSGYKLVP